MKNLLKKIQLSVAFTLLSVGLLHAQQGDFGWRIGVGTNHWGYYGDLSTNNFKGELKKHIKSYQLNTDVLKTSYSVFVERRISAGTSLLLTYNRGSIYGNDRSNTSNEFFARSLNFKTDIKDIGAALEFRADNDKLLSEWAFIAPYFFVGGGITTFQTYADLKDERNNFYNYLDPNTAPRQDGIYETELTELKTEGQAYGSLLNNANLFNANIFNKKAVPNVNLGLGLRFNLFRRFSLNVQTDVKYAFSDYLDDVHKEKFIDPPTIITPERLKAIKPNASYTGKRGNGDGLKDFYVITSASLRYNFGRRKETFAPPIFYASPLEQVSTENIKLVPNTVNVGTGTVVIYDTVRVNSNGYQTELNNQELGKAQARIDSLKKVELNNQLLTIELEESKSEYLRLQSELNAVKNTNDQNALIYQKATLEKLNTLQQNINDLSISAAANKTNAKDSTTQKIDQKYVDELATLRKEIETLKNSGNQNVQKKEQANLQTEIEQQKAIANVGISNEDLARSTASNEAYFKQIQTDLNTLSAQVAALTGLVANTTKTAPAYPSYQPQQPIYIPQTANNTPAFDNSANAAALEGLKTQLTYLTQRIAALEKQPQTSNTTTPVVIQQPASNSKDNEALMQLVQQLSNQLNTINSRISNLENRQPTVITQPAEPKIITIEKPVVVTQTVPTPVQPTTTIVSKEYISEIDRLGNVSIYFDVNSLVITPTEQTKINKIVDILRRYPEAKLTINGYADNTGNAEYNRKLSENRATTVRDRIVQSYGVIPAQVVINGLGIAAGSAKGNNPADRRVDIQWVR